MTKDINKTCCFTGHRPEFFPWGDDKNSAGCGKLLAELDKAIEAVIAAGVERFICGNARGVDTWAAETVLEKKEARPELFLEIAVPYKGHNCNVPEVAAVQKRADLVHVVTGTDYRKAAYDERNRYMVDNSGVVIAVWDERDGRKGGGTFRTMSYAKKQGRQVIQIPWTDCLE